ncbi:MAG TPA: xylose isomerase [Candidatus Ratteibacteria bacterium]|nr:xylose isomerase [Candidatus Ratteibacteria bacterium]
MRKSYHSVCRWTFNPGKGGFVPSNIRPSFGGEKFTTADFVKLVADKIRPKLPENIVLGIEVHYDTEINEKNIKQVIGVMKETGIFLGLASPGAHTYWAYGGISSLDKEERKKANEFGIRAVDIGYEMENTWDKEILPTFVLWNGSWGYDLATPLVKNMYENLKESIANLCKYEEKKGGKFYMAIEPKPNEGHPAMLLPTVASSILFWKKLHQQYGINIDKKGVNKEFGHSEMIGLDHIYDTVEEIDNNNLVHMHVNSQGYNDGVILGGPGKFDIDNGARVNGMNIAIAKLIQQANYKRWKGHDMQPRPYDNEQQAIERVIRSILSWEACEVVAEKMEISVLTEYMEKRDTAKAEDYIRELVVEAQKVFNQLYIQG